MTNNPVQDAEPAMAEQGAHISRPGPTQAIAPMGNNRIGVVEWTLSCLMPASRMRSLRTS